MASYLVQFRPGLQMCCCRAQGKGKIQKQKDFALKHDIKIGLPPTTHPPTTHPPENFFWYQWILGQILRHFYWWAIFSKLKR